MILHFKHKSLTERGKNKINHSGLIGGMVYDL